MTSEDDSGPLVFEAEQVPSERVYFASFEEALGQLAPPLENVPRIREVVAELDFDTIYIPVNSNYYVGLYSKSLNRNIAYVNRGKVDIHAADGTWLQVALPISMVRDRGGTRRVSASSGRGVCLECNYELSPSGQCTNCAE